MIVKTIAAVLDATALKFPKRAAVISPFQTSDVLSYDELRTKTNAVAGFLAAYGYETNDVLVSDLPNITENLILQIACNRLGVHYATTKNLESMAKNFTKIKGAVSATSEGFLAETNLPLPYLGGDFLLDLVNNNNGGALDDFQLETFDNTNDPNAGSNIHAFYNSSTGYTNDMAIQQGEQAAEELVIVEQDKVCISITLCHPFGIGSAVTSTMLRGAAIVLPAVGGIQGCGVPSERAEATFEVLENEKCTLLFADTHTLKALPDHPERLPALRGGVCKIGSGSDFLPNETLKYGGVTIKCIGKL